jgi:hypothetical protein
MRQQQLFEVKGMIGNDYRIMLSAAGRTLATERLDISRYCGPAPVSLEAYCAGVNAQSAAVAVNRTALRQAFDRTMADPEFLAEAKQRGLEVNPVTGADIDKLVGELYQTPPAIIAEVRAMVSEGAR